MNTTAIMFQDNLETVKTAFKDYMFHYYSEVHRKEGFSYDKSIDFAEKEKKINKLMLSEIQKLANINIENGIPKETWATHPVLQWAAFAVVNQLIEMILPDTINRTLGLYTEQRFIGWGDSALFTVEPNDLFYISKAGRNQRTVEFQRQWDGHASIVPENRAITVTVNLYRVLCGLDSIARFVTKALISLETHITKEVYTAFDTAMGTLPTTPVGGELQITGWDEESAIRLAQTVTAFNANSRAMFVGTPLALRHILPKDANYRYFLEDDYVTLGYLRNFMGFDTLVLPQVADWENPYTLGIRDDVIYVTSIIDKPIKLVYEGTTTTNNRGSLLAANLDETTTINKSYGIGVVTNAIAGVINL